MSDYEFPGDKDRVWNGRWGYLTMDISHLFLSLWFWQISTTGAEPNYPGCQSRIGDLFLEQEQQYFTDLLRLRVISSGASTIAHSAASATSSALNQDIEYLKDQVLWAGFDKLEKEDGDTRRVLLLEFQSGYQVWDVEDTKNVHLIVYVHDGHASFMHMLPNRIISEDLEDMFSESRPLLAVCAGTS